MDEVDGETVGSEPHEPAVAESLTEGGGQEDGDGCELDSHAAGATAGIGLPWDQKTASRCTGDGVWVDDEDVGKSGGPRRPVFVFLWVGPEVESTEENDGGHDPGEDAVVGGKEVLGRLVQGKFRDQGAQRNWRGEGF